MAPNVQEGYDSDSSVAVAVAVPVPVAEAVTAELIQLKKEITKVRMYNS